MKRIIYLYAVFGVLLCLMAGCKPAASKEEKAAEAPASKAEGLKIEPEAQVKMGIKIEEVTASEFRPEMKCLGHVLDSSPLVLTWNEIIAAKAALAVSQKELERVKILRTQNNASDRTLEAAQAATEKDRLAVESTAQKIPLTWGRELGNRDDLKDIVESLVAGKASLVRVDFPSGELSLTISHIQLSVNNRKDSVDAEFLGHASAIDPVTQGQGLIYLSHAGADRLPVNGVVEASIPTANAPLKGFLIARGAVIFHDGEKWFFRQGEGNTFERERLENGISTRNGYFVTNGIEPGLRVVTVGAQQLLSEELKSQINPE